MKTKIPVFERDVKMVLGFVDKHPGDYDTEDLKELLGMFYLNDNQKQPGQKYVCGVISAAMETGKVGTLPGHNSFLYPLD